jgi:hypothetical protein
VAEVELLKGEELLTETDGKETAVVCEGGASASGAMLDAGIVVGEVPKVGDTEDLEVKSEAAGEFDDVGGEASDSGTVLETGVVVEEASKIVPGKIEAGLEIAGVVDDGGGESSEWLVLDAGVVEVTKVVSEAEDVSENALN